MKPFYKYLIIALILGIVAWIVYFVLSRNTEQPQEVIPIDATTTEQIGVPTDTGDNTTTTEQIDVPTDTGDPESGESVKTSFSKIEKISDVPVRFFWYYRENNRIFYVTENGEIKKDNIKQHILSDVIKDNTHKSEREALVEILKSDIITKGEEIIKNKNLFDKNEKISIEIMLEIVVNNGTLSDTERAICIIYLKEKQKENTQKESKEDRTKVIKATKISKEYNF